MKSLPLLPALTLLLCAAAQAAGPGQAAVYPDYPSYASYGYRGLGFTGSCCETAPTCAQKSWEGYCDPKGGCCEQPFLGGLFAGLKAKLHGCCAAAACCEPVGTCCEPVCDPCCGSVGAGWWPVAPGCGLFGRLHARKAGCCGVIDSGCCTPAVTPMDSKGAPVKGPVEAEPIPEVPQPEPIQGQATGNSRRLPPVEREDRAARLPNSPRRFAFPVGF